MVANSRAERKSHHSNSVYVLAAALIVAIVLVACLAYARFVNEKIYEESTDHLIEVYAQVNDKFTSLVSENWKHLSGWAYHIASLPEGADQKTKEFVALEKRKWGFTDFYFLNGDGIYLTADGVKGYIDLGNQLMPLIEDGRNIVVDGTLPTGAALTVFAVPAETQGSYQGFAYSAVAVSYNNADMEAALNVTAFDGQSDCYVIYTDGRVLFSASDIEEQPRNFLAYIDERSSLTDDELAQISSDIIMGKEGVAQYRMDETDWYLVYQPIGFENWTMIGAVPRNVVNAAMNQIQWVTVAVTGGVLVLGGVSLLVFMLRRSKRNLEGKEREIEGKNREIESREQLFGALVENTEDIFILFSPKNWSVSYVSPNIEQVLGVPARDVMNNLSALNSSALNLDGVPDAAELNAIRRGRCWQNERERIHQRTGERRWYQETIYRETIGEDSALGASDMLILVLADRTKERENEQILRQALDLAWHANEAKSTFLANMSHDIRTPLNGAMGMTDIVLRRLDPEDQSAKDLRNAKASMDHLLGLINDILDMSKIESGQMTMQEKPCCLDDMIDEVLAIIEPQTQARSQRFLVDTENVEHRSFIADPLHINQVLLILLSNAVKYTPEGGFISFRMEELEPSSPIFARLRFTVSDNGIGMPPEFLERIFDPFERSDQDVIENIQGTGLGMPIAKSLVEAMGGAISVSSEVGRGSTFEVVLDLRINQDEEAEGGVEEATVQPERYEFEGKRFLLAEDNEINALVFMGLVGEEGLGAQVDWAEDGKQAVEMFASKPVGWYDAVFMDVMMPVMGGYAATAAIRALPREDASEVRIVALTANAFAEDVQAALDAGMNAHVSKPIVLDELEQTLLRL